MLIKRRRHSVPSLNTASTADISFMLLIFFLVTTSMDVDKGITRRLPPIDNTEKSDPAEVARQDIMQIAIDAHDRLTINGEPATTDGLAARISAFVEKARTRHLITVQTDAATTYDAYFDLQQQLVAAYKTVRDNEARRLFGRTLAQCTPAQRTAVMNASPQHVAENYELVANAPAAASPQTQNVEKGGKR